MNIITENLQLSYDDVLVIKNLNLNIPKGKITVIIGANGCGKSTLLKSIARILKQDQGNILLDGVNMKNINSKDIAKKMAVLPQSPIAPKGLSVAELVSYGRFPHKKGFGSLNQNDYEIIENSCALAGIKEFANKNLEQLSGGQRQRAWIAMALCQQTPLLLLDEPTTYLDLAHQLDILMLLEKLNKEENRTIVMVLHEINSASRFADYMIGMKNGEVISEGAPIDVLTKENMKSIFNIDANIIIDENTNKPMYLSYDLVV